MGWLILWAYLIGLVLTWIVAYGLIYKAESNDKYAGPVETILLSGLLSMVAAWFWPIIIVIFGIHRIATRNIGGEDVR